MANVFLLLVRFLISLFKSQSALALEVAALQHQIMILKRSVRRPKINNSDRMFWVVGRPPTILAGLAKGSGNRTATNRYKLASPGISSLLAMA